MDRHTSLKCKESSSMCVCGLGILKSVTNVNSLSNSDEE